jgi:hypothetical protein
MNLQLFELLTQLAFEAKIMDLCSMRVPFLVPVR